MQQKLKEHFGEKIVKTEISGKPNVVTFRETRQRLCYMISIVIRGAILILRK